MKKSTLQENLVTMKEIKRDNIIMLLRYIFPVYKIRKIKKLSIQLGANF